ncbi:hypothetical protein JQ609_17985 [Bradyrhizobium sp. AUGA SZCCT0169]|nr:hypothetical protein [Bradyrhizobium sp. AUGA SZCCT0169]
MEHTIRLYRTLFGTRAYVRSLCEGAAFLSASSIAIFAAVTYATVHASNHVTDFVLSRVGPYNVRFLFIYGTFTAFVITAGLLAWRPNRLPFALKATALFLWSAPYSWRSPTWRRPRSIRSSRRRSSTPFFTAAISSFPVTPECRSWRRWRSGTSCNGGYSFSR